MAGVDVLKKNNACAAHARKMSTPTQAYAMKSRAHPHAVDISYALICAQNKFPRHAAAHKIHAMPAQWKLPTLSSAQRNGWNIIDRMIQ